MDHRSGTVRRVMVASVTAGVAGLTLTGALLLQAGPVLAFGLGSSLATGTAGERLDNGLLRKVQADSKRGRNLVISGVKAFERSQYDSAVRSFTAALSGGGLSSQDMAKAMYFRGQAYQKSKRPAEAIADYTSAIWLSNGLSKDERARAEVLRQQAYSSAGVSPTNSNVAASTGGPAAAPAGQVPAFKTSAPTKTLAEPEPSSTLGGIGNVFAGWFGGGSSSAAKPAPSVTASTGNQRPSTPSVSGWNSATQTSSGPQAAPVVRAPPPARVVEPQRQVVAAVRQPVSPPPVTQNWTTAATPAPRAIAPAPIVQAPAVPVRRAPAPVAKRIVPAPPVPAPQVKSAPPSVRTAALPKTRSPEQSGSYLVQVAAVRSRGEAERLARQLVLSHGSLMGSHRPQINEAVFGNMGTFYRVQVGPYLRAGDSKAFCTSLKAAGFDCLITTK